MTSMVMFKLSYTFLKGPGGPITGQRWSGGEKREGHMTGFCTPTNILEIILTNCFIHWVPTALRGAGALCSEGLNLNGKSF